MKRPFSTTGKGDQAVEGSILPRKKTPMLRFAVFGLLVSGFLLTSDVLPWLLEWIGRPDAISFLDGLLMLGMFFFTLLFFWGLVLKFGRMGR